MKKTVLVGDFLERTYDYDEAKNTNRYKISDVMREHVYKAMKEFDLSLPEREIGESDSEYEETCLDVMHDVETEVASIAKSRFIASEGVEFTEKMDELICEITWNELSHVCLSKIHQKQEAI